MNLTMTPQMDCLEWDFAKYISLVWYFFFRLRFSSLKIRPVFSNNRPGLLAGEVVSVAADPEILLPLKEIVYSRGGTKTRQGFLHPKPGIWRHLCSAGKVTARTSSFYFTLITSRLTSLLETPGTRFHCLIQSWDNKLHFSTPLNSLDDKI